MTHRPLAVLTLMFVLALPVLGGCGDQTAQADAAIARANARLTAYTKAGNTLEGLMAEAKAVKLDAREATRGVEIAVRMTGALEAQRTAATAARAELATIAAMDVRPELKTYAAKQIAVADALLDEGPVAQRLVDDLSALFALVGTGKATKAAIAPVTARIDESAKALAVLEAQATRLEREASAYYDQQKLGGG